MDIIIGYIEQSIAYKMYKLLKGYYEFSAFRSVLCVLTVWFNESFAVKAFKKFSAKLPTTGQSVYHKMVNKKGAVFLVISAKAHDFFVKLLNGSIAYKIYSDFVKSDSENKLRSLSVFVFYFCLSSVFTLSLSQILTGKTAHLLSGKMTALYITALLFLLIAVSGAKTRRAVKAAFQNSVFIGLLRGLLE